MKIKHMLNIVLVFIISLVIVKTHASHECSARLLQIPAVVRVGEYLTLYCVLDEESEDCDVNNLELFLNVHKITNSFNKKVLNTTTIQLKHPYVTQNTTVIELLCGMTNTSTNTKTNVIIGDKPKPINNFNCATKDFIHFNCNFDKNEDNAIRQFTNTVYNVKYSVGGADNTELINHKSSNFTCEFHKHSNDLNDFYDCIPKIERKIILNNIPIEFYVEKENEYGNFSTTIVVRPYEMFKPLPICDIQQIVRNNSDFEITMDLMNDYPEFLKQLEFVVEIKCSKCETDQQSWEKINNLNGSIVDSKYIFNIGQLKYGNMDYEMKISYRIFSSQTNRTPWANCSEFTFHTIAILPEKPPLTQMGLFEILENNQVNIFWKPIDMISWNDASVSYAITNMRKNGKEAPMDFKSTNNTVMKLDLLEPDANFTVPIRSKNVIGFSVNASEIFIPSSKSRITFPTNLQKILIQYVYTLKWQPEQNIKDYTILICEPVDEQKGLCKNVIDVIKVDNHIGLNGFTYDNNHGNKISKIFGIAANTNESSSGIVWFPCSKSNNTVMSVIEPFELESISPKQINLKWSIDCSTTTLLKFFKIRYCVYENNKCKGVEFIELVPEEIRKYSMTHLKPHTNYRFTIAMHTGEIEGPQSAPKFQRTPISFPSAPKNLKIIESTNNSITIVFEPTAEWNGVPEKYNVIYNNLSKSILTEIPGTTKYTYTLTNLDSYLNFTIKVEACNRDEYSGAHYSSFSNVVTNTTKIGMPGFVRDLKTNENGLVHWRAPSNLGGPVQIYEILFTYTHNGNEKNRTALIKTNKCTLNSNRCQKLNQYAISVRALNIEHYEENAFDTISVNENMIYCAEEVTYRGRSSIPCDANDNCYRGPLLGDGIDYCRAYLTPNYDFIPITVCMIILLLIGYIIHRYLKAIKKYKIELPSGLKLAIEVNSSKPKRNLLTNPFPVIIPRIKIICCKCRKQKSTEVTQLPHDEDTPFMGNIQKCFPNDPLTLDGKPIKNIETPSPKVVLPRSGYVSIESLMSDTDNYINSSTPQNATVNDTHSGYIPNNIPILQPTNITNPTWVNGYVTADSLMNLPKYNTNPLSETQQTSQQNHNGTSGNRNHIPVNSNGYVTTDVVMNFNPNQNLNISSIAQHTSPPLIQNSIPVESNGYVTQEVLMNYNSNQNMLPVVTAENTQESNTDSCRNRIPVNPSGYASVETIMNLQNQTGLTDNKRIPVNSSGYVSPVALMNLRF